MPLLSLAIFLIPVRRRYARELYNRFVANFTANGLSSAVLAGNHDSVATLNESRRHSLARFSIQIRSPARGLSAPRYFIVATVLRAPYCAPFLCARADILTSHGIGPQRETAATSSCDCRLLSTAVSGSMPATRRTKAAGYRDGAFNHRRRQQKAMRFATFISVR